MKKRNIVKQQERDESFKVRMITQYNKVKIT